MDAATAELEQVKANLAEAHAAAAKAEVHSKEEAKPSTPAADASVAEVVPVPRVITKVVKTVDKERMQQLEQQLQELRKLVVGWSAFLSPLHPLQSPYAAAICTLIQCENCVYLLIS